MTGILLSRYQTEFHSNLMFSEVTLMFSVLWLTESAFEDRKLKALIKYQKVSVTHSATNLCKDRLHEQVLEFPYLWDKKHLDSEIKRCGLIPCPSSVSLSVGAARQLNYQNERLKNKVCVSEQM